MYHRLSWCAARRLLQQHNALRNSQVNSLRSTLPFKANPLAALTCSSFHTSSLLSSASPSSSSGSVDPSSFLSGNSAAYIDAQFLAWRADPNSVHRSWDAYFRTGSYIPPPNLLADYAARESKGTAAPLPVAASSLPSADHSSFIAKIVQLVRAFQVRGHLTADIDPLQLLPPRPDHELLSPQTYGITAADMERLIDFDQLPGLVRGFLDSGNQPLTVTQLVTRLRQVYCGNIGYEYMHIPSVEKCNWIRERIETREKVVFSKDKKINILKNLTLGDHFERFLMSKYTTAKRFGLEGGESLIPGMIAMIEHAGKLSCEQVVLGMPHRGRLNVLHSVVKKPAEVIFCEFRDAHEEAPDGGYGDVKYHLGYSHDAELGGKKIHLSLVANPSHLEAVNPVVLGKTRAKQFYNADESHNKVLPILMHGDAAFAGQGVVYETMGLSQLKSYSTGGTIHIIVNNQIGFTTDPKDARSSVYCSDLAKGFNVPVFHVNGDEPEAVAHVMKLATEWRFTFHSDVIVDLVCYRKLGHNEVDEPQFTQPTMYKKIKAQPSTLEIYTKDLIDEGVLTKEEAKKISDDINKQLEASFAKSQHMKANHDDWMKNNWTGLKGSSTYSPPQVTGVDLNTVREIGLKTSSHPPDFKVHPRLVRVLHDRVKTIQEGKDIDWATGEALAFGSLSLEGKHVRLSGQDVERGTFSHRHSVLHDQDSNKTYTPLNHLSPTQAFVSISNSSLSEFGVMGFEYGYSMESPHQLVLWEGQFGDFYNGAQVIVDQFLSAAEDKWQRQSGLVLLLPHAQEGAGPEHSSGRMERFLQMTCDHPDELPDPSASRQIQQANWQIANCSTPASYFHILRRQVYRSFRKPLIIFTPKSLLRLPAARSTIEEFGPGTKFQPVLAENDPAVVKNAPYVKRWIICSGKIYYDLLARRTEKKLQNVAITRLEQIAPFPFYAIAEEHKKFKNAEVCFVQEEPYNMGAWTYVQPRMLTALRVNLGKNTVANVRYIGRRPHASPAAGHQSTYNKEQEAILHESFAL